MYVDKDKFPFLLVCEAHQCQDECNANHHKMYYHKRLQKWTYIVRKEQLKDIREDLNIDFEVFSILTDLITMTNSHWDNFHFDQFRKREQVNL